MGWGAAGGAAALLARAMPAEATTPGIPSASSAGGAPGLAPFPQQEDLNFETLFAYGESAYGAGEVGEVAATVALVQADMAAAGRKAIPAYDSYVARFEALANRLAKEAAADQAAGRTITARAKHLRSASYYNCVLFFILGTRTPAREGELYRAMQAQWSAAAALLTPAFERVEVSAKVRYPDPAGGTKPIVRSVVMPAYFARADGPGRKPTVIVNNGSDAQFVDVYAFGAAAALERGYNALIFEGPGQGSLLFEQNIPFTPYWQDVVTPLVDYLVAQPEVDPDRLGISGWSFGGLLVFRAAAFEPRLKAVVGDPGYLDNSLAWTRLTSSLEDFGGISNANFQKLFATLPVHGSPDGQLALKFTLNKRGEIYSADYRNQALAGKLLSDVSGMLQHVASYTAGPELISRVKAHVLIDNYEGDQFFPPAQSDALKAALTNAASVTQHSFTAAQGAEYHCAPMAPQLRNEVVYDWMDGVFSSGAAPAAATASAGSSAIPLAVVGGAAVVVGGSVMAAEIHRRKPSAAKGGSAAEGTIPRQVPAPTHDDEPVHARRD